MEDIKEVIKKDVEIQDNVVVVVEETKEILTKAQLERKLMYVRDAKSRIQEHNKRLIAEFRELELEEQNLLDLINQITIDNGMEEI